MTKKPIYPGSVQY